MDGLPVTIRLLDPPLHEFLPHDDAGSRRGGRPWATPEARSIARVAELHEFNPMLGHRGCRLGITYPEIYEMQAARHHRGGLACGKPRGARPMPEIMIPLVGRCASWTSLRAVDPHRPSIARCAARRELADRLLVGTMIELPRAAWWPTSIAEPTPSSSRSAPTT
jgi:pyruvate,orthophosphate dikinase